MPDEMHAVNGTTVALQSDGAAHEPAQGRRYWLYTPGGGAKRKCSDVSKCEMAIGAEGFEGMDLAQFATPSELETSHKEKTGKTNRSPRPDMLWNFSHVMRTGDIVYMRNGSKKIIGYGIVTGDCLCDVDRSSYSYRRPVEWVDGFAEFDITPDIFDMATTDEGQSIETLYDITDKEEFKDRIDELMRKTQPENVYDRITRLDKRSPEVKRLTSIVEDSKNVILRGAPGTGKTYLARQAAARIVSGGAAGTFEDLRPDQRHQIGFVQFHPSFDYSDFVEGLRPVLSSDGSMSFALRPGIFRKFVDRARESHDLAAQNGEPPDKFVFIIDEINRGDISKIFGELFFAIDPGYRGRAGTVETQYSAMHDDTDKGFFVPGNVYIIGTMNDIDRSVDSFDFAMRRRFRFIEIAAEESRSMLDALDPYTRDDAIRRMDELNSVIAQTDELGRDYNIGAAYFLKLQKLSPADLWTDHLEPLLQDYVRGMYDSEELMQRFKAAYMLEVQHK